MARCFRYEYGEPLFSLAAEAAIAVELSAACLGAPENSTNEKIKDRLMTVRQAKCLMGYSFDKKAGLSGRKMNAVTVCGALRQPF